MPTTSTGGTPSASTERYARPGVDAVARHVAERDPAARRRR
ncbi:PmrA [Streptomyces sp. ID03-2B]|nr:MULTISPECIES: PmrA [unclassified Streptomyces]MDX3343217.1 PmrA [Streptomyces sp. ME02-6979.5a]MDX3593616.1 PmrA [Streptomyces sp. ID03-2B]